MVSSSFRSGRFVFGVALLWAVHNTISLTQSMYRTKTGHTSLRGASITCVETFVPHGGPEMVLMMPSGRGIQGPKVDKVCQVCPVMKPVSRDF